MGTNVTKSNRIKITQATTKSPTQVYESNLFSLELFRNDTLGKMINLDY